MHRKLRSIHSGVCRECTMYAYSNMCMSQKERGLRCGISFRNFAVSNSPLGDAIWLYNACAVKDVIYGELLALWRALQLLAVGRWFPPGTPVSSTSKLISSSSFHRLDMTLAVAKVLTPNKPINQTGELLAKRIYQTDLKKEEASRKNYHTLGRHLIHTWECRQCVPVVCIIDSTTCLSLTPSQL